MTCTVLTMRNYSNILVKHIFRYLCLNMSILCRTSEDSVFSLLRLSNCYNLLLTFQSKTLHKKAYDKLVFPNIFALWPLTQKEFLSGDHCHMSEKCLQLLPVASPKRYSPSIICILGPKMSVYSIYLFPTLLIMTPSDSPFDTLEGYRLLTTWLNN